MATRTIIRKKILVTCPLTQNRVQISPTTVYTADFSLYSPAGNGLIYAGDSTVDDTWIPITASASVGAEKNYVHGDGNLDGSHMTLEFDLKDWYIYFQNPGETAIVEYLSRKTS